MNYDIIVPVTERNFQMLSSVVSHLRKNVSHRNIFLLGQRALQEKCSALGCKFIDENRLYGKLDYNAVRELTVRRDCYAGWRAGWYLQQFLKMSYSLVCSDEYYLVWDADTIPVRKIRMFDDEDIPYFDISGEYNRPYFTTLNKVFAYRVKKSNQYSYISEHMIIKTEYMRKLIFEIEENQMLEGKYYFEKIMNSICEIDLMHSGFSEFETYGNYVDTYYPGKYKIRRLKALRTGDRYLHHPPTESEIRWAAASYDIVTMENRQNMYSNVANRMDELMENYSLEEVVSKYGN